MADDKNFQRLVVSLEGRIDKYEKALAKAQSQTNRSFSNMEKTVGGFETKLSSVGKSFAGFGKNIVAGLAGGLLAGGIAGIVTSIGQVATSLAAVGDEAKRAGVDIKSFQELRYVAEQNRLGVDALTDGLKELNLRADEWVATGGGAAAEAFQRLGFTADELKTKLQDPSALFTEIIGKLGQLDKAAQIRIADEIFGGTGGEKFVQLIAQGEEGIRRTIEEAHNLGIVMDEDLIAKAEEVDRKFNQIANTLGSALKSAIVDAAFALQQFIDKFNATQAQTTSTLDQRMRDLGRERLQIENSLMRTPQPSRGDTRNQRLEDILEEEKAILEELAARRPIVVPDPATPAIPPSGFTVPGSRGGSTTSDAEREAKAIQNLIAGLEFERSLIGLSAAEQAKMNALRSAGATATEAQKAQIASLVDAISAERAAADQAAASMQALGDIGVGAASALVDAFADGKLEASELLTIVTDIVKQLIAMPSGGAGGGNWLGSLFSSIFGGGSGGGLKLGYNLASGGQVHGPGTGRSDSIPARLSNGEFVVNAASTKKNLGLLHAINGNRPLALADGGHVQGGAAAFRPVGLSAAASSVQASSSTQLTYAPTINAPNSDMAAVARLEQVIAKDRAEFSAKVITTMRRAKRTNIRI